MRLVIDMQGAQTESRFRGIGRYSLSLALAIARNAGGHEIWLVLNAAFPDSIAVIRQAFAGLIPEQRLRVFDAPAPTTELDPAYAWRARTAEIIREHFLQGLQPDWVLVTSLFEGYGDDAATSIGSFSTATRTAVILYDLIPFTNPAAYLPTVNQRQYYDRKIQSLKKADLLFAISAYSRQEAIDALGLEPARVTAISTAVDACFKPEQYPQDVIRALTTRLGITRKIVLCAPGGFDARKNIDGLIKSYALLSSELRAVHQLVIASKLGEVERLRVRQWQQAAGLADDELVLTGYLADAELIMLYNLATLFVFPSKHEGFGLPLLEAMSCGAPAIGSDATSIPEVLGLREALFDPYSPQAIADKMAEVLTDDGFRQQLSAHGLQQAATFSWDATAQRLLQACEDTLRLAYPAARGVPALSLIESIAAIDCAQIPSEKDLKLAAEAIAFNNAAEIPRQLLVDISEIVQRDAKSGIQRVVRSILLELLTLETIACDVRPIYFDGLQYRYANRFTAAFLQKTGADADDVAEFNQGDTYLGLDLNAHLTEAVHPLHRRLQTRGVYLYFVVYDILLLQRPDWWPAGTAGNFAAWLSAISEVSTGLICISGAVADEVKAWLTEHPPHRLLPLNISYFHLGADVENSKPTWGLPDDAQDLLKALAATPSFLTVGTVEPRKGHKQMLETFELLWAEGLAVNLVIVGKQGWMTEDLCAKIRGHQRLGERLFWLQGISDEYLEKVYAACACLIAASEGEGFGLPLIEAAMHRLPIIARDLPVFQEVAGDHAFYFTGFKAHALAEAVKQWLLVNAEGNAPKSEGLPWLTWRQSTRQLLAILFPEMK